MNDRDAHMKNDIALTGEYALRLMPADEADAFRVRIDREPHLRRLIVKWQEDLAMLAEGIAPVAPPKGLKESLRRKLFGPRKTVLAWCISALFSLGFLRFVSMVVLAAGLYVLFEPIVSGPKGDFYSTEIGTSDGSLKVVARFDHEASTLEIDRRAGAPASGRALELWLFAVGADVPISLGLLSPDRVARYIVPEKYLSLLVSGTLAISDEPASGSDTGLPTGRILARGQITKK